MELEACVAKILIFVLFDKFLFIYSLLLLGLRFFLPAECETAKTHLSPMTPYSVLDLINLSYDC